VTLQKRQIVLPPVNLAVVEEGRETEDSAFHGMLPIGSPFGPDVLVRLPLQEGRTVKSRRVGNCCAHMRLADVLCLAPECMLQGPGQTNPILAVEIGGDDDERCGRRVAELRTVFKDQALAANRRPALQVPRPVSAPNLWTIALKDAAILLDHRSEIGPDLDIAVRRKFDK
jgi:hypothetical protein